MTHARPLVSRSIRLAAALVGGSLLLFASLAFAAPGGPAGLADPAPIGPTNLTANVVHDRLTIALVWDDNVAGETGWVVERSESGPDGAWVPVTNLPANTARHEDSGLEDGVTYWYRVAAVLATATGIYSNVASGTASDLPMPPIGDADCDGAVTSIDSALVLQHGAGLLVGLACGDRSDANADGAVDARDAQLILQFVAGLIARLPPPSGISGLVLIGPICPVEREDMPCPDQPFVAKISFLDDASRLVRSVTSDTLGRFHTELLPGSYVLQPQSPNPGAPPFADEQTVSVEPAAFTEVLVQYDSGIR